MSLKIDHWTPPTTSVSSEFSKRNIPRQKGEFDPLYGKNKLNFCGLGIKRASYWKP